MKQPKEAPVAEEVAHYYLRDIEPPWKGFWFHMHSMARNLSEFAEGVQDITDEVYNYHNSGQKQDFAAWVQEVVGDSMLARKLLAVSNKEEAAKVVQERVAELKKALNRPS
ncbi:MAG: hypothetical protein ACK2UH_16765 [Candidatus Promineifilaceae bacterium]